MIHERWASVCKRYARDTARKLGGSMGWVDIVTTTRENPPLRNAALGRPERDLTPLFAATYNKMSCCR